MKDPRFPTYLRVKRLLSGWTLKDLAEHTRYAVNTLRLIERGYNTASSTLRATLCETYGCEEQELFDERGNALVIPKKM